MLRVLPLLFALAAPVFANTPDLFATTAKPNGPVHDVAQQSGGQIVAVGDFTRAGSASRLRIARYRIDGTLDTSFVADAGANGKIQRVAVTEDDEIIIAGDFTTYQGNEASHAAVLSPDGSFLRPLNLPATTSAVHALAVAQNTVYIGGDFSDYCRTFNLSTGTSLPFPNGRPSGIVRAICVDDVPNGPFFTIGGDFTRVGTTNVGRIAHFDRDNRLVTSANQHAGANGPIRALDIQPGEIPFRDRAIIAVAGDFTNFNGSSREGLAAVIGANPGFSGLAPGGLYSNLGGSGTPRIVGEYHDIEIFNRNRVAIGGSFTAANSGFPSENHQNLVFAYLEGGFGIGTESDHRPNQAVHGFCEQADGMLVIGGEFSSMDNLPRANLTRLYGPGGTTPPRAPTLGIVYPLDDDSIFVSWEAPATTGYANHYTIERRTINGDWEFAGSVPLDRFRFFDDGLNDFTNYSYRVLSVSGTGTASLSTKNTYTKIPPALGTAEADFDTSVHSYNSIQPVNHISIDAQQRVLAAESSPGHLSEDYLLHRFLPDGRLDESFTTSFRSGLATALEALPDGNIMIGGEFLSINGQPIDYLARLREDGSVDPGFNPVLDAKVTSILPMPDGGYLIAGTFDTVNGMPREKIARLHANGEVNDAFEFASNDFSINSISHLQQAIDGSLYFSASITPDLGSTAENTIFMIDGSGTPDPGFSLPADLEVQLLSRFQLGPEGKLYLAGRLWPTPKPSGYKDARLVRLLANGAIDPSFNSDGYAPAFEGIIGSASTTPNVTGLIVPADGKAIATGTFNFFDGRPRFGIARHSTTGKIDHNYVGGTGPQVIVSWHEEGFYNASASSLATLPNGTVVAGGVFTGVNGIERQRVAALHSGPYTSPATKPATPTATAQGNERIQVAWTPIAKMTGYIVERRIDGESSWAEIARVPSHWRYFVDSQPSGTTASYRIRSVSGDTDSTPSASVSATATSLFGAWLESHGLPSDSDPDSDDDHDQLSLLLEYALQRNPLVFDAIPWHSDLDSGALVVETPLSDVLYTVEESINLSDWETADSKAGGNGSSLSIAIPRGESPTHYFRLTVSPLP